MLRVDLHVHTPASDGISDIEALSARAKSLGLSAIAVCDHNMCTPLPKSDIMLIPAVEISTRIGHVVGLFVRNIDFEKLFENGLPDGRTAVYEIHARGGLAVLAHPFEYKTACREKFDGVDFDFIETANSRAPMKIKDANARAAEYAVSRSLPETGGSDAHSARELGGSYTEIDCEDITELEAALRAGRTRAVFVRGCKWRYKGKTRLVNAFKSHGFKKKTKAFIYYFYALTRDAFKF